MTDFSDFLADNPWSVYVIAFMGPFVQEDVAVLGAAMTAASGAETGGGLIFATWIGLIFSDGWKYLAGRLAHHIPWAAKLAANPRVVAVREKVLTRVGIALMIARFVPGTRIPLNVACGVFRVPVIHYAPFMAMSAALYLAIALAVFHIVGEVAGEEVRKAMPFVVIPIVLLMVLAGVIRSRRKPPVAPEAAATPTPTPPA